MTYFAHNPQINFLREDSEKIFHKLIEEIQSGVYMADEKGDLIFANQAFVNILGYDSREQVLGLNFGRDICVHSREQTLILAHMVKTGFVRDYELNIKTPDGRLIEVSTTCSYIRGEGSEIIGVQGIVNDITGRKRLGKSLKAEKFKLEEILSFDEHITTLHEEEDLADFIVQKTAMILNIGRCSLLLSSKPDGEFRIIKAVGLSQKVIENTVIKLSERISGVAAAEGRAFKVDNIEYDKKFRRRNKAGYSGRSFISVPLKIEKKVLGVLNVADKKDDPQAPFTDLDFKILKAIARHSASALVNANLYEELEILAITDPITRLPNYRLFMRAVSEEMQRQKRFSGTFSILIVDVDDFKGYNDSFGHLEGDEFLKRLGELMTGTLRSIDKVCRYGGDEFIVLLPGAGGAQATLVAERLRRMIENESFKHPMTVSIGVAEYESELTKLAFTSRADEAMYRAKKQGKNQVFGL